MDQQSFVTHFSKYVPEEAAALFHEWTHHEPVSYRITKPRNTKLGDFRAPVQGFPARISVNGNLNPYAFMVTFTHEFAHYLDFKQRKTLKNPHGPEWKQVYGMLLSQVLERELFPKALEPVIHRHIQNPKAASCSDPALNAALKQFDDSPQPFLKELPENSYFRVSNGRVFRKGPLRRTRYRCQEVDSGRWYLVHGQSEVEPMDHMATIS